MARIYVRPKAVEKERVITKEILEAAANRVMGLHTNKDGYLTYQGELWHRLIWEEANGFPPPDGWHIHHIDGVKQHNDIDNLIALPEKLHSYVHAAQMYHCRRFRRTEVEDLLTRHLRGEKLDAKGLRIKGKTAKDIWAKAAIKNKRKAWLREQRERQIVNPR